MFRSRTLLLLTLFRLTFVDALYTSRSTGGVKTGSLAIAKQFKSDGFRESQAGVRSLVSNVKRGDSIAITNDVFYYTANVGVGSPPTNYTLIIDAGIANTWVGSGKQYVQTNTSQFTGNNVSLAYSNGNFSGEEWIDTVTLSPDLVIQNQSIGVANTSILVAGVDGILGLGPLGLTADTVTNTNAVPTISDNLYSQGKISEEVLGVYFVPESEGFNSGMLTFGGVDPSVLTSDVNYVQLTTTSPASNYWGIDMSIDYGGETILSATAGIVDTATASFYMASDAFQKYQNYTGGVVDDTTGLLTITDDQYNALQTLSLTIGGHIYDLSPNAQIWPRSLNIAGNIPNAIYPVVADIGHESGSGFDFIVGFAFLERFYSVFDTTNQRVGFATTVYTDSNTN